MDPPLATSALVGWRNNHLLFFPIAVNTFKNPSTPEELPYQSFDTNHFYMTLNTTVLNYPCPEKSEDEITVLRVGSETKCATDLLRPDCNGPLPGPGPYR